MRALVERFLAWLIEAIWKREKAKVSAAIIIRGKTVPLADIEAVVSAIPAALRLSAEGKTAAEIAKIIAPTLEGVAEDVVGMLIPGGGVALGLAIWALENSRPMTQEETNAWMDRAGAGSQS